MKSIDYLAGIFDGEGTIVLMKQGGVHTTVMCSVGMKDRRVLEHFSLRWGGSLCPRANSNGMWQWQITATKALKMLEEIGALLITKKEQAWLAQEFAAQRSNKVRLTDEERALRLGYGLAVHFAKERFD